MACVRDSATCEWRGISTYGVNGQTLGHVSISLYVNLNGRVIDYWQYSEALDGPLVNAEHSFNCVGSRLVNGSCSGGWQRSSHGSFTAEQWNWPADWRARLAKDELYWMDVEWQWAAAGIPGRFAAGRVTTAPWSCRANGDCSFGTLALGKG